MCFSDTSCHDKRLVVLSVHCSAVELHVGLDHLVDSGEKVFFGRNLAAARLVSLASDRLVKQRNLPPNGKHARFCSHTPQFRTGAVGAQTRDELPPNITLYAHALGVDAEDVRTTLHVG
jgi:hypothetical protein